MANSQLIMVSGRFDEHRLFGAYGAEENNGFDREHTLFGSSDPDRMRAFFESEFERRGGTQDDVEHAGDTLASFFGRLSEESVPCVTPWEGMMDGLITWYGDGSSHGVRQLYIQEEYSLIPGFPPNLDLPEGTVWALYANPDSDPMLSGTVALGEIPDGARQVVPADGSEPALVEGRTYRIFATADFMLIRDINCTFVHQAQGASRGTQ